MACCLLIEKDEKRLKEYAMDFDIWDVVARLPGKSGQTMTEYALILAVVAVVAVATYITLGTKIVTVIGSVVTAL
jgi:Flp pilus assembly pilin Flp